MIEDLSFDPELEAAEMAEFMGSEVVDAKHQPRAGRGGNLFEEIFGGDGFGEEKYEDYEEEGTN